MGRMLRIAVGVFAAVVLTIAAVSLLSGSSTSFADPPGGGQFCGGFAGIPCPEGFVCVDDPHDDCNPKRGGADCAGICKRAH